MSTYEYRCSRRWPTSSISSTRTALQRPLRAADRLLGWVGGAYKKEYDEAIAALKWKSVDSLEWAGVPDDATLAALREEGPRAGERKVKAAT